MLEIAVFRLRGAVLGYAQHERFGILRISSRRGAFTVEYATVTELESCFANLLMQRPDLEPAIECLRQRIATLRAVYLFGSQSREESGPKSDVDIAFLADVLPSALERHEMASDLSEMLGREVDLVDLAAASTVMRAQVIGRGTRVAGTVSPALEEYESRVLSDYARLNEERAAILRDIEQRGTVHG